MKTPRWNLWLLIALHRKRAETKEELALYYRCLSAIEIQLSNPKEISIADLARGLNVHDDLLYKLFLKYPVLRRIIRSHNRVYLNKYKRHLSQKYFFRHKIGRRGRVYQSPALSVT